MSHTAKLNILDLVHSVLANEDLAARQWVKDARRLGLVWSEVPSPVGASAVELSLSAALVKLFAQRANGAPPPWVGSVGPAPSQVVLSRYASLPRVLARLLNEAPDPLRKRNFLAPADYLSVL